MAAPHPALLANDVRDVTQASRPYFAEDRGDYGRAGRLDRISADPEYRRRLPRRGALAVASAASLGPYRLLEPLGQGGMGVVYRARHNTTERAVAIKTVRIPSPRWIESIRREVEALTRVHHPGIVRILEHGVHGGRPWYAMELLEGEVLRDFGARIWSPFRAVSAPAGSPAAVPRTEPVSGVEDDCVERGTPVPVSGIRYSGQAPAAAGTLIQILALMRRLCATLAFLHGEGFVSCDLKPENIVLVGSMPIIIDFGLSTRFPASTGREAIDAQGSMAGTLFYMSPEQVRGELVDARSDLYSVGCILYELLTGAPPFAGAAVTVRAQHLSATPRPPSSLVRDVPPALDSLVLRLLAKEPGERVGFADEVAATLAEIGGDPARLHDLPPARPYLYRPRFVGRADALETLGALRDRATVGRGTLALLAGESGVGKTRLALELARTARSGLRVLASESFSIAPEQIATAASAPLHAVRPLLRAIADRCQEGGAETTDQLLGPRRSVLAVYESLLLDVPSNESLEPVVELAPDASRQRLFRYLAQTLSAFAQERPILWILDDIGWADDLSIGFLQSLSEDYFASTPAFLLATYRSEEIADGVRNLAALPYVVHLQLPRLALPEVSSMIADMLALPEQDAALADYVANAAEGNPFFVTEHVRSAVDERLLYRDAGHTWRMRAAGADGRAALAALPIPRSLRELIEQRLQSLTAMAQDTARTAAVLGREFDADVVAEITGVSRQATGAAIDELIRRHVLEQASPERLRFAHDKLREVAYAGTSETLQSIHARAAAALEARWSSRPDAAEAWAILGHHFAAAGQPAEAARYLKRAGDHARRTFANADAVVLYRRALAQVQALGAVAAAEEWRRLRLEVHEALGDVLAIGGRRDAARVAYADAVSEVTDADAVVLARLHRKEGKTWEWEGNHRHALSLYTRAREALPPVLGANTPDARDEWMHARFDELRVYYWLAHLAEIDALVAELQPVVERHGTAAQRVAFYQSEIFRELGRTRYSISEDTLGLGDIVVAASVTASASEHAWALFQRGFLLLLWRRAKDAEVDLSAALQLSERAGDVTNQARSAVYFAIAARMQGRVEDATERCGRALKLSTDAGMPQYIAAIKATFAWIRLRRGDTDGALELTATALSEWSAYGGIFPFHWLALVPRLDAMLARDRVEDAVQCCRALLAPDQRRLPPPVEASLTGAVHSWASGDHIATRGHLATALEVLADHDLR